MLVLVACTQNQAFVCDNDAQCVAGNGVGRCEADRHCSYPDGDCESGRRYGEYAGARSGQCVEPGGVATSSSSGPATSTSTATSTTASSTATTSTTDASSSSSGGNTGTSSSGGNDSTGNIPLTPLGHWPLDENQGVIVYDAGSAQHDGVVEDGTWVVGADGTSALQFPAEDDGVDIGAYAEYDLVDAPGLSLMGWARFDSFVVSNPAIIAKFGAFGLQFWGTDVEGVHAVMYLYPEGGSGDGDTDGPLDQYGGVYCNAPDLFLVDPPSAAEDLGQWHHYAGTYDVESRMLRFYLDGVMVCERDVSSEMLDGSLAVTATSLQLARWQTSGPTVLGAIDDVRIYDQMVASEDIAAIASVR